MFKRSLLTALLCFGLTTATANAQNLCPSGVQSDKLICVIPQVYGVNGLLLGSSQSSSSKFNDTFLSRSLQPLNSAIGRQTALLPSGTSFSGLTFTWDPVAKVFASSSDSLGPILGERAETIGRHRAFLGFHYQYFKFDSLDGISLKNLPVVFTQPDDSRDAPPGVAACSIPPPNSASNTGPCSFIRDVIKTANSLDLKIHNFTTLWTYGITNYIDISMAVPIETVRMGILSNATIVDNANGGFHSFPFRQGCGSVTVDQNGNVVVTPCLTQSFPSVPGVRSASGIGDLTFRVKGEAWKGKRAGLALGVDVRAPTGDALNFLGAGAWGVKPFVVWSYRSPYRIATHAFVGYETNGNSVLAGDISTGKKARLPGQLAYSGGVDVWLARWFTTAFDIVGQQVFEGSRTSLTTLTEPQKCLDPNGNCADPPGFALARTDATLLQSTGTYNSTGASIGLKITPFPGDTRSRLQVTANVLLKLNEGGLRAKAVPLVGLSYTF